MEVLGLLLASAGASFGLWALQRRREYRLDRDTRAFEAALDGDAAVVLSVAQHEAGTRQHRAVWPLHLLYGLLQDETFVAAITRLEGDATALENHVQAELDKCGQDDDDATAATGHVLGHALAYTQHVGRKITVTDLFAYLSRLDSMKTAIAAGNVKPTALLFLLVHGMPEPTTELPDRTDVHIVLRNDDYTTREFVVEILREIFELDEQTAETRMMQTHNEGRAIVGRFKLPVAREKIDRARTQAREHSFPLWIGVEDC